MGFADRVPHTNGCLQHCGNERKALHPVPRVKEAILNTDVNRDWYKWKDKRGAEMEDKVKISQLSWGRWN